MSQNKNERGAEVLSMEEYLKKRQVLTARDNQTKKLCLEEITEDAVIELAQLMYM